MDPHPQAVVRSAGFDQPTVDAILSGNACRLFGFKPTAP